MADRYWVGGAGQWNTSSTANWSASSGGPSGASRPTAADSVFFDDASGSGAGPGTFTVTLTGALTCLDINITRPNGTLTFAGTGTIACSGSLNANSGAGRVVWSATGLITFNSTSARTITTNGQIFACPWTFNGVGGSWQFQDNFTSASTTTAVVTLTAGTLDFNARTMNFFRFASPGTSVRTITATGATINITGNASTVLDFTTITNLTLTGWACNFTYAGAIGNRTISLGAFLAAVAFDIVLPSGSDNIVLTGTMRDLNFTGFSGTLSNTARTLLGNLTVSATMTITDGSSATSFAGTGLQTITTNGRPFNQGITIASTGGTVRLLDNLSMGIRTLALNSGTLDLNDFILNAFIVNSGTSNPRSIAFGTTGIINLSGNNITVWGITNATSFSYTGTGRVNLTYAGAVGTRSIAHGSGGGVSYATRPPPIYITGGSDIVSITANSALNDVIITGGTFSLANTTRTIYGNLILRSGISVTAGANATIFAGVDTQTFDSAELITGFPITVSATGNVVLANTVILANTSNITLSSGTFNSNSKNVTAAAFLTTGNVAKTLNIGNTTLTLVGANTVFQADAANTTVVAGNSNILLNNDTTANRAFIGGNHTYNTLTTGGGNIANTIITGNNTFGSLTTVKTVGQGVLFLAGSTTTVSNWGITGTVSAPVTISSNSASQHRLVKSGGGDVVVSYATISYSNATPVNTWYAPPDNFNTNAGNNTGWIFGPVPVGGSGNFFLMF